MADEELRKRLSESAKRKWADPVYREEMRIRRETGVKSAILAERSKAARKERERLRGQRRKLPKKTKPYHYEIICPDGSVLLMEEVRTFCRHHGIHPGVAYGMMGAKAHRGSTKGHKFRRIEVPFPAPVPVRPEQIE